MKRDNIAAEYYCYTKEELQEIICQAKRAEQKRLKRKQKERLETLKLTITLSLFGFGLPVFMIIWWIIFGY